MAGEESSQPLITSIEAPQMVSSVKLPILNKGEYILWAMKMEQYLAHTDYALWEVILNGNSFVQMTKDEAESTSNTNELNAVYSVSTATGHSSQHKKRHFSRDCRSARNSGNRSRDAGNAGYKGRDNGKRPAKEEDDEQALVVEDGIGSYDWSYQVEKEATDFALMAFTLNPLSSSSSHSEHEKLSKANIEIIGYQYGLESMEGQLHVHQQNEVLCEEKIGVLEHQLEKFETSSKNLTKLLDSQISAKVKTGLGYDSQLNKKEVLDIKEEEVTESVFDNRSSDEKNSVANERFKKGEGYHAVPSPLTGNYMPPKSDLSFAGLDDSICKFKISETVTSLVKYEKDAPKTSTACVEKPKEDWSSAPLIEDWETDSNDDIVITPEPITTKIDFVKDDRMAKQSVLPSNVGKGTSHKESRPVWNNVQRINHQNKFTLIAVFTRSSRIPVSASKPKDASTSAAKPVNTAGPKQSVNFSRTRISAVRGNGVTAVKTSACYVWRPRVNAIDQLSKIIVNSGCSRHMRGNKAYLVDYQKIHDGGFVAFGSSKGNQTKKNAGPQYTNGNACTQDIVDAGKEVYAQHYIVLPLWSSISSTYKSSDDKPADDKPKDGTGSKTVEEPVDKEEQAYRDELDRLMSHEKEASDVANALRKECEQRCMDQRGVTQLKALTILILLVIQLMLLVHKELLVLLDHHLLILMHSFLLTLYYMLIKMILKYLIWRKLLNYKVLVFSIVLMMMTWINSTLKFKVWVQRLTLTIWNLLLVPILGSFS
uniref:Ribonuclease H-like domain-containing protein n=1 Tax=Tanacetum cinerariifolium TaxID=118510 RepID=A0A6L2JBH1_TANCI|nr:ribonuclease H-like domain-containing protein [Tanacetum cinerariifolium]